MKHPKFLSLFFLSGFSFIQSSHAAAGDVANELLGTPRFTGTLLKASPDDIAERTAREQNALGKKAEAEGNRREAIEHFEKALAIPQWTGERQLTTAMTLADCYFEEGNYQKARSRWRLAQATLECPQDEHYFCTLQIGFAYRAEERHEDALSTFQNLLIQLQRAKYKLGLNTVLYQVGASHEDLGDPSAALWFYQKITSKSQQIYAAAQYRIGRYHQRKEENNLALEAFSRALEDHKLDPKTRARCVIRVSELLQNDGKLFDSILYLQEALKYQGLSEVERGLIHYQLGLMQKERGHSKEAIAELRQAREKLSSNPKAKEVLGSVLFALGQVYVDLLKDKVPHSELGNLSWYEGFPFLLTRKVRELEARLSGNLLDQTDGDGYVLLPEAEKNTVPPSEAKRLGHNTVVYARWIGRGTLEGLATAVDSLQDLLIAGRPATSQTTQAQ